MSYVRRPTTSTSNAAPASASQSKRFAEDGTVLCHCGEPATSYETKKAGPNLGRMFYKCPKEIGKQCGLFLWADDAIKEEEKLKSSQSNTNAFPSGSGHKLSTPTPSPEKAYPSSAPPPSVSPLKRAFDFHSDGSDADEIEFWEPDSPPRGSLSTPKRAKNDVRTIPHTTPTGSTSDLKPGPPTPMTEGKSDVSEWERVMNDPESPFHETKRRLFGEGSAASNGVRGASGIETSKTDGGEADAKVQGTVVQELEAVEEWIVRIKERAVKDARVGLGKEKQVEGLRKKIKEQREELEKVKGELDLAKRRNKMLEEFAN